MATVIFLRVDIRRMNIKGSREGQIFHLRVQVARVNQLLVESMEMWSVILALLYSFVALSTALST